MQAQIMLPVDAACTGKQDANYLFLCRRLMKRKATIKREMKKVKQVECFRAGASLQGECEPTRSNLSAG